MILYAPRALLQKLAMPVRGSPDISLELSIKHLAHAMRNPMSKNVCAVTMGVSALRIEEELERHVSATAKARFINAHPDLLRAGMHFLTASAGMAENFLDLKAHLYKCKCEDTDDFIDLHFVVNWFRDLPEGVTKENFDFGSLLLYAAVNIISNCLFLSLSRLAQHKYRSETSEDSGDGRASKWPQGPNDLFPNGLAQSYNGLEGWVMDPEALQAQHYWEGYVPVEYNIYQLIGQLVAYHEPFAFSLLNFPKISILFVGMTVCLQQAGLLHKTGKLKAFERVLRVVLDFYDAIEDYDHIQFQAIMEHPGKMLQNWWIELNDILASRSQWNKLHRRVYRLAVFAQYGMCDELRLARPTGPALDNFIVKPKLTEVDRLEDAFNTMVRTRKAGCLNPQCTPSTRAVQTRLCSKCKVVRYCGEKVRSEPLGFCRRIYDPLTSLQCQRQAWKAPKVPHKDLCAKIEALKDTIGDADWERMWRPGFTFAAFHSMVKGNSSVVDLVQSIGVTLSKVIVQKNEKRKAYVAAKQNSAEYAMEEAGLKAQLLDLAKLTGLVARLEKGPLRLTELTHPVL